MKRQDFDDLPFELRDRIEDAFYKEAPPRHWTDWLSSIVIANGQPFVIRSKQVMPQAL